MTLDTNEHIEFGFAELGLPATIVNAVSDLGFVNATPIQVQAIPLLLEGRDILGLASTGSGKTASFMLPLLANLEPDNKNIQILVLSPTRELAVQVATATNSFLKYTPNVSCLPIYGGQKYEIQTRALRKGVQIVVATPGRLVDLLSSNNIKFDNLKAVVLDEADEMLSMGFADDLEKILQSVPKGIQTALFSATMPNSIEKLTAEYLKDPAVIKIKKDKSNEPKIEQNFWIVQGFNKNQALLRFLEVEKYDAAIIFTRTKAVADEVNDLLLKNKISSAVLHGDISQNIRETTLGHLRKNKIDVLVATDVAARGLDIDRIDLVINYDMPADNESYVHRVGRTGRAGREGKAITFVVEKELRNLYFLEKEIKKSLNEVQCPSNAEISEIRKEKFKKLLEAKLNDHRLEQFSHLVHEIIPQDYEPDQVLAALINLATIDSRLLLPEDKPTKRRIRYDASKYDRRSTPRASKFDNDNATSTGYTQYLIRIGKNKNIQIKDLLAAISTVDYRIKVGRVKIFPAFTTVELPSDLAPASLTKLKNTKLYGSPLNFELDPKATPSANRRRSESRRNESGFSSNRDSRGKFNRDSQDRRKEPHGNRYDRENRHYDRLEFSYAPAKSKSKTREDTVKKFDDTRSGIAEILTQKVNDFQKELASIEPKKILTKVKKLLKGKE